MIGGELCILKDNKHEVIKRGQGWFWTIHKEILVKRKVISLPGRLYNYKVDQKNYNSRLVGLAYVKFLLYT